MKFTCFGGAAAVADEAVVARHRSRHGRGLPSIRGKFLPGNKGEKGKESSSLSKMLLPGTTKRSPWRQEVHDVYDLIVGGAAKSSSTSSVPTSSALSSTASLDSARSSSSACSSSRSSSSPSSSSLLEVMPQPVKQQPEKRSPAAGPAAVLVCLVMMAFCGRFAATLLTSVAFYFFPRRWPARARAAESAVVEGVASSAEQDVASTREEETMKRKEVMEGFLPRNRKK